MQLRDVDEVYKRFQAARVEVLSSLDPASARLALQRLIPYPVRCLRLPESPFVLASRACIDVQVMRPNLKLAALRQIPATSTAYPASALTLLMNECVATCYCSC